MEIRINIPFEHRAGRRFFLASARQYLQELETIILKHGGKLTFFILPKDELEMNSEQLVPEKSKRTLAQVITTVPLDPEARAKINYLLNKTLYNSAYLSEDFGPLAVEFIVASTIHNIFDVH